MLRILALLVLLAASAQAQSTSLTTYVKAQLPTNTSRAITAVNVQNAVLAYPNNVFVSSSFPVTTTSYVSASAFYGDGSHLTNVAGGSSTTPGGISGSVQINNGSGTSLGGDSFFTYLAGLLQVTSISTTNISSTGPISASTYYGDGSHLTGISSGGVSSYNSLTNIPSVLANISNSTGSVTVTSVNASTFTGGNFVGNGSALTGISASSVAWQNVGGVPTVLQNISNSTGSVTVTSINAAAATLTSIGASSLTASGIVSANTLDGFFLSATAIAGNNATLSGGLTTGAIAASGNVSAGSITTGSISSSGPGILSGLWQLTSGTGTLSATNVYANHVSASLLYGDGSNITNLPSGGTPSSLVSSTTRVDARSDGTISLTTGGVVTGYMDTSGRFVLPGISATTNQTSVTTLAASGLITANGGVTVNGTLTATAVTATQINALGISATDLYLTSSTLLAGQSLYVRNSNGNLLTDGAAGYQYDFNTNNSIFSSTDLPASTTPSATVQVSGTLRVSQQTTMANVSVTAISGNGSQLTGIAANIPISATQNHPSASIYVGFNSGGVVTSALKNTTLGDSALASVTTGGNNTVVGSGSVSSLTTSTDNISVGQGNLTSLLTGAGINVAIGNGVMTNYTGGGSNIVIGNGASSQATTASGLVVIGVSAGGQGGLVSSSINSVYIGGGAAQNISGTLVDNTFVGARSGRTSFVTGISNTLIGAYSGDLLTTGSNNIAIGASAIEPSQTASNQLSIANKIYGLNLVSGSTGLIGINTESPTQALEVVGTVSGTAGSFGSITVGSCTGCGGGGGASISTTTFTAASNISNSTAIGFNAYPTGTGINNTIYGASAGLGITTASSATLIGYNAGRASVAGSQITAVGAGAFQNTNNAGAQGVAIGYQAAQLCTNCGGNTVAIGVNAMRAASGNGVNNIAIGNTALGSGVLSGARNIGIGMSAGSPMTTGNDNVFAGDATGASISTGSNNVGIGSNVLSSIANASNSTVIGVNGFQGATGNGNTGLGYNVGAAVSGGTSNTIIGSNAGSTLTTGGNNILIGAGVQSISATVSSSLNIGNAIAGNIGSGTGRANLIGINVTSPTAAFEVSGTVAFDNIAAAAGLDYMCYSSATGQVTYSLTTCTVSDRKFKTNIAPYDASLATVMAMQVREFDFKNPAYGQGKQVGLIAQELQQVAPNLVSSGSNGDMSVDYAKLSAYNTGAIQVLQHEINELRQAQGLPPLHTTLWERLEWLAGY